MQALSKTMVWLLLAAVIAAPLAAQGVRAQASSQEPPAGCHEDGGKVPEPGPASHSCCQGGHHPAILQQSSASRSLLEISAVLGSSQNAAVVAELNPLPNLPIVSGDPPVLSALRV
jgi:hypothetical protein